ncbi:hypothetical protein [Desulforamulus aquiferis]|uniref:Transmembrane protein n=1 Tax=Desulforamulus aquiferis TaxID=1397668 RepID=A0AAW7ZFQ8_9FIRM|nr:hypothetical protein [Desulforamulus aquiferis]MDO7788080.1 hypothetical protein [Desulforamulus aquiferis]RYD06203.1 hypothetical protein N752_04760 [Desulforamulus aquiferis]
MSNVLESIKEKVAGGYGGNLGLCCCLLLALFIIGIALVFCGLLPLHLLGLYLFLALAIFCCCFSFC